MLWIALRVPQLPLEIFLRGMPTPEPFAIAQGAHILACDHKAMLRGVRPGMSVPTALALAPRLIVKLRDAAAETEALLGLAAWASGFTPSVALEFPDGLLLEISGSLKLLGGLPAIVARLRTELADMGFGVVSACAPTLRAAWWLAHAMNTANGRKSALLEHAFADARQLKQAVAALPLSALHGNGDTLAVLQALGAETIGDVLALPRDGVARRFGQSLLDDIDRALGRLPEARTFFRAPEKFHAGIELPAEVTQSEALLFAAKRLFMQLGGFLAARSGGVQRIAVKLAHRAASTEITIGLVAPSRDGAHFTLLLRERLARLALREPVRALSVSADDIVPLAGDNLTLLAGDTAVAGQPWERLIERLRARLGSAAVQSLALAADHRPEQASVAAEPGLKPDTQQLQLDFGERPFWLLAAPRPIREVGATLQDDSDAPLELLAGPERIESGWWDGGEALRDYFVARSQNRSLLWIYRERQPAGKGGWYLHGIFS